VRNLHELRSGADPVVADGFSSEIFCRAAEEFIRGQSHDKPFFVCVALTSPHDPRTPPPAFRALYDAERIPLPDSFRPEHEFDNGELESRDELLAAHPRQPAEVRRHIAEYYGMISHHDAALGPVFAALQESGRLDDTIIVYVSDHGLALGAHGLLGKQNLYEHSVRVPLIIAGPGVPAGARHHGLVYSLDLFATLCELCGIGLPAEVDSRSLVSAFGGTRAYERESLGAAYMDCQRMIVEHRWKLIVYRVNGTERVQLFDLDNDPHEMRNLAGDPATAGHVCRLRRRLSDWQERCGDQWMRNGFDPTGAFPVAPGALLESDGRKTTRE
jgi:arylsulfatase A-like enzyme